MLKFAGSAKKGDITNEVVFEGTMLRNGIMSLSDELKFATRYDRIVNNGSDSMFDRNNSETLTDSTLSEALLCRETLPEDTLSDNLDENVFKKPKDEAEDILEPDLRRTERSYEMPKNVPEVELTHNNATCDYDFVNNTCQCYYKTSTPVRVHFDPYEQVFPLQDMRKKVLKLQTTAENMEEIKCADDMLENALALSVSSVYQTNCSPRVKKSLKKISESSKKGALTVFTAVLTNIL